AAHGFHRVRKCRLPAASAFAPARADRAQYRADPAAGGGSSRRGRADAGGALRWHGTTGGPGARHRAGSVADHLRRALCRPRSGRIEPGAEADPYLERYPWNHQRPGRPRVRGSATHRRPCLSDRRWQGRRAGSAGRACPARFAVDAPVLRRRGGWAGPISVPGARLRGRSRLPGRCGMKTSRRLSIAADALAQIGAVGLFFFSILAAIPKSLRHLLETVRQIWFVGAMSLVIIMTCGLFVGAVLGLQLYDVLSRFGSAAMSGTVVALALFRELGPVVTALLFAGRAGTSITAEIGLMRATDQLAAMEMMAVDPLAYVVAPRFLAGIVAMPLLVCVFNAMAILGAHVVCVSWLGLDNGTFWGNMTATVDVWTD